MPILIHFTYKLPAYNHITGRPDEVFEIQAEMWENGLVYLAGFVNWQKVVNPERMQREMIIQARKELREIEQQQTANLKAVEKILRDAARNDEDELDNTGLNEYLIYLILLLPFLIK